MKSSILVLFSLLGSAFAACDPETTIALSEDLSKLTVTGFESPIINYFSAISGTVSKCIFVCADTMTVVSRCIN